jgi:hypothetical protein
MKSKLAQIAYLGTKVNRQNLKLFWTLIALALLLLGIGAPAAGGGGSI